MTLHESTELTAPNDERVLIGSCVRWPEIVAELRGRLTAEHFSPGPARSSFEAIEAVADRGELPVWSSVADELRRMGTDVDLRSGAYLLDCCELAVSPMWVEWHALNVLRAAKRRGLLQAGQRVEYTAQDSALSADEAIVHAQEIIAEVQDGAATTSDVFDDTELGELAATYNAGGDGSADPTLPLGLIDLDAKLIGGARPGQLIVVGGRTGMGKSALLRKIAYSFAQYGRVLFASNEMTAEQLMQRDLSVLSGVPLEHVMRRSYTDHERDAVTFAESLVGTSGIRTVFDRSMTSATLRKAAVTLRDVRGLSAVVVDYLQNLRDPGETDYSRVSAAVRSLKSIALELRVPLVVGAQLNRKGEVDDNSRPNLTDLRDTGEIEQTADVVILLYRANARYSASGKPPENVAELIIAKQRQGQAGTMVKVAWLPAQATFRDLARF